MAAQVASSSSSKLPSYSSYPTPQAGASLLLAFTPPSPPAVSAYPQQTQTQTPPARRTILLIGQHRLAAARAFSALEAGLTVLVAEKQSAATDAELRARLSNREIQSVDLPDALDAAENNDEDEDEESWLAWLQDLPDHVLDDILLVCVTDTLVASSSTYSARSSASALAIRKACFRLRIPINIADHPNLSDFHFPATHRFPLLESASPSSSSQQANSESQASPLQIAITTNASSCRLASRIRREIVTKLPKGIGSAVAKIGQLRELARQAERNTPSEKEDTEQGEREEGWSSALLNKPVPQILSGSDNLPFTSRKARCTSLNRTTSMPYMPALHRDTYSFSLPPTPPSTPPAVAPTIMVDKMEEILAGTASNSLSNAISTVTRMRFIAQISEYWPIDRLATMSKDEAHRVISLYSKSAGVNFSQADIATPTPANGGPTSSHASPVPAASANGNSIDNSADVAPRHQLALSQALAAPAPAKRGRIFLLGSGPGSPALLTMAAHSLLTQHATLILSDKLVPPQILALIPPHIPLTIAKKFPGNAEGAQNELMDLAYEGAVRGETVVRLKQGDPYVYGRGGEEVLFFRERGFEAVVVPGISSAFAAPLMAGIPVTQRGVSESVVVCTGVGRKGKGVKLPGYERARTTVVLMGVARLPGVIHALTSIEGQEGYGREGGARDGAAYPPYCPIAIIERASSPDQRMVASTLEGIVDAMDRAGEQRPPGMMIIGWSALALEGEGDVEVLDGIEGMSADELETVDRARVARWLGSRDYIVRDGLDASWFDLLDREEPARIVEDVTAAGE